MSQVLHRRIGQWRRLNGQERGTAERPAHRSRPMLPVQALALGGAFRWQFRLRLDRLSFGLLYWVRLAPGEGLRAGHGGAER